MDYPPHDARSCPYCHSLQTPQRARGVAGLLASPAETQDDRGRDNGEGLPYVELESILATHAVEAPR